jgi:hypothetical protein
LTLLSLKNWNEWCLDVAIFLETNRISSFSAIACKKTTSGEALLYLEDHIRELKTYGKTGVPSLVMSSSSQLTMRSSDGRMA